MILVISGSEWPNDTTAMPEVKSRYFLLLEAVTYDPSPLVSIKLGRGYVGRIPDPESGFWA
jgi:hypothetical protein